MEISKTTTRKICDVCCKDIKDGFYCSDNCKINALESAWNTINKIFK